MGALDAIWTTMPQASQETGDIGRLYGTNRGGNAHIAGMQPQTPQQSALPRDFSANPAAPVTAGGSPRAVDPRTGGVLQNTKWGNLQSKALNFARGPAAVGMMQAGSKALGGLQVGSAMLDMNKNGATAQNMGDATAGLAGFAGPVGRAYSTGYGIGGMIDSALGKWGLKSNTYQDEGMGATPEFLARIQAQKDRQKQNATQPIAAPNEQAEREARNAAMLASTSNRQSVDNQMGERGLIKNEDGTWGRSPELERAVEENYQRNVAMNRGQEQTQTTQAPTMASELEKIGTPTTAYGALAAIGGARTAIGDYNQNQSNAFKQMMDRGRLGIEQSSLGLKGQELGLKGMELKANAPLRQAQADYYKAQAQGHPMSLNNEFIKAKNAAKTQGPQTEKLADNYLKMYSENYHTNPALANIAAAGMEKLGIATLPKVGA